MLQDYMAGIVFLVLTTIVITILSILIIRKGLGEKHFDERQVLMQNRSYKASYFALLIYMCFYMFFKIFDETLLPMDDIAIIFIGVSMSTSILAIANIVNDAYFRKTDKPKTTITWFVLMVILDLVCSYSFIKDGNFIIDGKFTNQSIIYLVAGIEYFIIVVTVIIKRLLSKKGN